LGKKVEKGATTTHVKQGRREGKFKGKHLNRVVTDTRQPTFGKKEAPRKKPGNAL